MRRRTQLKNGEESDERSGADSDSGNDRRKAKKRPMPDFFDRHESFDALTSNQQWDLLESLP